MFGMVKAKGPRKYAGGTANVEDAAVGYATAKTKRDVAAAEQLHQTISDTTQSAPSTQRHFAKGTSNVKKKEKWIQGAVKKPGQLHRDLGIKQGKKIPAAKLAAAAKRPGKVGQRARFAQNVKK